MLPVILSLSVSVLLLLWILRMKKDDPFPRGTVIRLLLAGVLSSFVSAFVSIVGAVAVFVLDYGTEPIVQLFEDPVAAVGTLSEIASGRTFSPVVSFIRTFIIIGVCEEIFKYLFAKGVIRRKQVRTTGMNVLLCMAITAIGFQMCEDIAYSSGSVVTAIVRALTPFHFTLTAVMGYYLVRARMNGKKAGTLLGLLISSLLHALFDFSIKSLVHEDLYILLFIFMTVLLLVLTVVMILKIRKWNRDGTMDAEIEL